MTSLEMVDFINSQRGEGEAVLAHSDFLKKAISIGQRLGETLVINIELASGGLVRCDDLRPDVDWSFLLDWALLRSNKNKAAYGANRESIK